MEAIHIRLREELSRCDLSVAEAARLTGEANSQGLRDVLGGRKRLSAETLGLLAAKTPIDALYILTGQRNPGQLPVPAPAELSGEKQALLGAFDGMSEENKRALLQIGAALSQPNPDKIAS